MSYTLNLTVGEATRKLVLVGLANHANRDGTAAFPGVPTLAEYAECSPRTVQRHISFLLEHGYLREGDQKLVDHYDARRRPMVYDLSLDESTRGIWAGEYAANGASGKRQKHSSNGRAGGPQAWGDTVTPQSVPTSRGDTMTPLNEGSWGDTGDRSGVTPVTPRGDTHVTQTVPEPSIETVPENTSSPAAAGDGAIDSFDSFWSIYPRKVGKDAARRVWNRSIRKVSPAEIIAGARRYATDPNLPDAQFVAHPSTWLHAGRWADETPLPERRDSRRGPAYDNSAWDRRDPAPAQPATEAELDAIFGRRGA